MNDDIFINVKLYFLFATFSDTRRTWTGFSSGGIECLLRKNDIGFNYCCKIIRFYMFGCFKTSQASRLIILQYCFYSISRDAYNCHSVFMLFLHILLKTAREHYVRNCAWCSVEFFTSNNSRLPISLPNVDSVYLIQLCLHKIYL